MLKREPQHHNRHSSVIITERQKRTSLRVDIVERNSSIMIYLIEHRVRLESLGKGSTEKLEKKRSNNKKIWTKHQKFKKMSVAFRFFQFSFMATLSHWHQDFAKATIACFGTC